MRDRHDYSYPLLPRSTQPPPTQAQLLSDRIEEMKDGLRHLPAKGRKVAIEVSALAALLFALNLVLANSSSDLRSYRAYFLSTCRDASIVIVGGLGVWRFLSSRKSEDTGND